MNVPVLAYPQFEDQHPFILETDASTRGLGAVLAQQQVDGKVHPIAFASRSLNTAEGTVGGPFEMIGVDVLLLPLSHCGNQYAVVFQDYLTKWPEAFAVEDQKADTIARLLVEHVVARHGLPQRLLSDRGSTFLSKKCASCWERLRSIPQDIIHNATD